MTVKLIVITTAEEGFETTEITIPDGEDSTVIVNLPESKVETSFEKRPTLRDRDTGDEIDFETALKKSTQSMQQTDCFGTGQSLLNDIGLGEAVHLNFNSYDS